MESGRTLELATILMSSAGAQKEPDIIMATATRSAVKNFIGLPFVLMVQKLKPVLTTSALVLGLKPAGLSPG